MNYIQPGVLGPIRSIPIRHSVCNSMFSVNIDSLLQDSAPNDPTFSLSKGGASTLLYDQNDLVTSWTRTSTSRSTRRMKRTAICSIVTLVTRFPSQVRPGGSVRTLAPSPAEAGGLAKIRGPDPSSYGPLKKERREVKNWELAPPCLLTKQSWLFAPLLTVEWLSLLQFDSSSFGTYCHII